ncbi:DUF3883 domain-containing protein [Massilia sp. BKSP1R2A-1]|uniref:DUF3883 domain-containing protein n=1 Tax=Massilia sp. BKSP1R2A-1 TaxID=3422595 RepID=UPI003D338FFA
MKDELAKLVATQRRNYSEQPSRMVSDYNRERQLIGEYNGRQILEMLQNADDEGADAVLIRLDVENGILTIANKGNPFTVDGFESLMLANLSTKTKLKYIGNKGLGFRSIINWAHQITIDSDTVSVTFSEAIARQTFEQLFDEGQRAQILQSRNLSAQAVPVAFLAVPEFADRTRSGWTTEISIHYRPEFLVGIKEQLANVEAKCLLFLNHINDIVIVRQGEETRLQRRVGEGMVNIDGETWTIKSNSAPLPEQYQNADKAEQEWYSLKLALSPGLTKGAKTLYTFFPTKVNIDLPMVIHGTFDLDSSRNQLIDSSRNRFLLTELVKLIVDTAQSLREDGSDPWIQVRTLRYRDNNPVLKELGFYQYIERSVRELEIFPCVDGRYRRAAEVYYIGDAFSELVLLAGCGAEFPGLVYPGQENLLHSDKYRRAREVAGFTEAVNLLSAHLLKHDLTHRVTLISILCSEKELAGSYSLLVNDNNELIDAATDAYTPLTAGLNSFVIPGFVNIDFMSHGLFEQLVARLGADAGEKARDIQRKLKSVTTIHSYEPAQVIRSIIRGATTAQGRQSANAQQIIGEMVSALLTNFSALGAPAALQDVGVRLLNANLEVADARELFLSRSYPTGVHTERLFAQIYQSGQFLAAPSAFGSKVADADPALLERLFLWLGVNRFVRYVPIKSSPRQEYVDHIFSVVDKPTSYREASVTCLAIDESVLATMLGGAMKREELVEWLIRDPDARKRLEPDNPDVFDYSRVNENKDTYNHRLAPKPSYLHFQLRKAALFDGFLLDRDVPAAELVNPFTFDFAVSGLTGSGVERREIETVMSRLGAKDRFDQLPLEAVAGVLRRLPESDPQGKLTQRIYRLALTHFDARKQALPRDVPLFAYMGQEGRYYPQNKVYYSDNIRLPRKIVNQYPVFDFSRRGGGDKVAAFFGVNSLNQIPIHVHARVPVPALTEALASMLKAKLPFVLAYRIHGLQNNRKAEAVRLAKLAIVLCTDITCEVGGESFPLAVNDYVKEDTTYLIKVAPASTLDDLTRDPLFCDTFADIIASVFTVNEFRAEIRGVFKDPLIEVEHLAYNELGEQTVREARQLLGMADPETAFWTALWAASHDTAPENVRPDHIDLLRGRLRQFGIDAVGLDFEQISAPETLARVIAILKAVDVQVEAFNRLAFYKMDLGDQHRKTLLDRLYQYFGAFRYALWKRLEREDWSARGRFLALVADYEHPGWIDDVARRHREQPELDYDGMIHERIHSRFDDMVLSPSQDHEVFYRQQSRAFSTDELASLSAEARSFLYFEGGLDRVQEQAAQENPAAASQRDDPTPAKTLPAQSSIPIAVHSTFDLSTKPGGSHKHSPDQDTKKRASGESAEKLVIASLIAVHGEKNVVHVAHQRDGAGYDIRYSADQGVTWRHVEVKRYTQNCIHLSRNEYRFAAANRATYELFLVTATDEIHCLRDINFGDPDRFGVIASEFIVSFRLEEGDIGYGHSMSEERGSRGRAILVEETDLAL